MSTGIKLLRLFVPLFLHFSFSPIFNIEFFRHTFLGNCDTYKIENQYTMDSGQMYHVYRNQAAAAYSSFSFYIFLSLQFSILKFFVTIFSGTIRPRRLKLGTHVDSGQMYCVYRNLASAAYSSLYFFILLSLQLSNIKNFHHIFLRNCEA